MSKTKSSRKIRPALTPEGRESQLISLAMNEAERQLIEGTASSQVITHFLKLGTTLAILEKEKLEKENELLKAKTESLKSAKRSEELFQEALAAMKSYSGQDNGESHEDWNLFRTCKTTNV